MPKLRVESSPDARRRNESIDVDSGSFTIGRLESCSLALADTGASRRHAEIRDTPEGFRLVDLGSANGTMVNGTRVEAALLRHGDRIEIGQTTLVFDDPTAASAQATVVVPPPPPPAATRPAPVPAATPVAVPGQRRAGGGRTVLLLVAGCLTILVLPILVGVGWWLWTSRAPGGQPSRVESGAEQAEPERELVTMDLGIPKSTPLVVTMGSELAAAKVSSRDGGSIETPDGLTIRVPPGALPDDRTIRVSEATVPDPSESVAMIGGGNAKLTTLKAWDVDAGPSGDLFPGEIELTATVADGTVPLYAAISVDNVHWTRVPAEIDGNVVRLRTRHFCPVTILGLSQAAAVVLPIVAITYLVVERADELPDRYHPYAPFVSVDVNPRGFEIYWSKSLPGVDKTSGFRNEKDYLAELEKVAAEYSKIGGGGTTGAASLNAEVDALKKKHLMPDKVREVEEALVYAQAYLKKRGIAEPVLSLPVYVVPTLGQSAGLVHNPWAGRRYMMVGADAGRDVIWTVALHELFHHYQTGYVWLDRTGHLPFLEASALLMEREAIATYKADGKPFNAGEGLALAQMLVYRNGLDGPAEWKEEYVRGHGYGLTWFLEYLRDEKYVGLTKKNAAGDFHAALLKEWGGRWTGALHKGLVWAAGGERDLASGFKDFAQNYVLQGRVDKCGSHTPYGSAYVSCPFQDSPYASHTDDYGLPASKIDLMKTPVVTLGDSAIRPWSIQFYEITAKGASKASVVVRAPRSWFPKTGPGRGVYLREKAADDDVEWLPSADLASPAHPEVVATMPAGDPTYAYVVDTGQTGSGWFSENPEMTILLLGPPENVKSETVGKKQRISWTPPKAASTSGMVQAIRVYSAGSSMPERTLKISETSVELDVEGSARAIELTSAIEVGKDKDGGPVYVESPRSDPVGSADAGNYEMCVEIFDEVPKPGSSCADMYHYWYFSDVRVCFPVNVASDGSLRFSHSWSSPEAGGTVHQTIQGSGTFIADKLHVNGSFNSSRDWRMNEHDLRKTEQGSFEAFGKYTHGIWFGEKLKGTFSAEISDHYCASATNGECTEWKDESDSCSGNVPPVLSSIESFTRK